MLLKSLSIMNTLPVLTSMTPLPCLGRHEIVAGVVGIEAMKTSIGLPFDRGWTAATSGDIGPLQKLSTWQCLA